MVYVYGIIILEKNFECAKKDVTEIIFLALFNLYHETCK